MNPDSRLIEHNLNLRLSAVSAELRKLKIENANFKAVEAELKLERKKNSNLQQVHANQMRAMRLQLGAMNVHSEAMAQKKKAELVTASDKTAIALASIWSSLGQTAIRWIGGATIAVAALYYVV